MAGMRGGSEALASVGLLTSLGMLSRFPTLLQMMSDGELSVVRALPVVLGLVLLLIASVRLLVRHATRGKLFAAAAVYLLITALVVHTIVFWYLPWLALAVSVAGAILGFRTKSGPSASA